MDTLLISFGSFTDAVSFADNILETKLLPAAVEVMNDNTLNIIKGEGIPDFEREDFIVAVALEAFQEAVARMRSDLNEAADRFGAKIKFNLTGDEHRRFWLSVSEIQEKTAARYPSMISVRLNYPLSQWGNLFRFSIETLESSEIPYGLQVHAGSGSGLISLMMDDDPGDSALAVKAIHRIFKNCLTKGGNMMVQRAPFGLKKDLPVWGEPGQDWPVMKRIKEQTDPLNVMSPGRFLGGL
jgi:glycolate oxidase FAD binding subunit